MVALAVQLAVDRRQADGKVVTLLARLLERVVAALGVIEAIQASRIDVAVALEQRLQAGRSPRRPARPANATPAASDQAIGERRRHPSP